MLNKLGADWTLDQYLGNLVANKIAAERMLDKFMELTEDEQKEIVKKINESNHTVPAIYLPEWAWEK